MRLSRLPQVDYVVSKQSWVGRLLQRPNFELTQLMFFMNRLKQPGGQAFLSSDPAPLGANLLNWTEPASSVDVQLMLSWWRNLISCRVDYQCLVLTNIVTLVGVIHTRGQYIRSHSTGEDFISLIVAVYLNKQLTAVWLKFGVLDFRRKRLIGVGSTLTYVENDQGVGLPWHSLERTLLSRDSFLQWSVYSLTGL